MPKRLQAQRPTPNVSMPIDSAGKRFQAVIQMERFNPRDPDQSIELRKRRGIVGGVNQWIPGRENMARINAHTQPLRCRRVINNPRQLFKLRPQRRALPRRGFQQRQSLIPGGRRMNVIQRCDNPLQSRLGTRRNIRPGVHHHANQFECLSPFQFVLEGVNRLLPQIIIGAGQIDQITVMSHRLSHPSLFQTRLKIVQILRRQRLGIPLVVVLREELTR